MPYTNNKNMPRIRRDAAQLVYKGWSARKVGRYFGYHPIPTQSSEPESHPKQLKKETVRKIVEKRLQRNRYAEAVCKELQNVRCDLMN